MEIGKTFVNLEYYNQNMQKGLEDKLFFLNHLDLKEGGDYIFVDFGCADGTLISAMCDILGDKGINVYYIGYDISETMIELAKTRFSHKSDNVMFTTSWDEVKEKLELYSCMESILILSSVIHEVFSYAESAKDIFDFFDKLNSGFRYICIRDMMCSEDLDRSVFDSDKDKDIMYAVKEAFPCGEGKWLREFEKEYGSISHMKNLVHFLLKYRWKINWDRELHENYFCTTIDEFLKHMNLYFNINYLERFRVPFLEQCWKEDFGIELDDYTHVKMILEKKKNEKDERGDDKES